MLPALVGVRLQPVAGSVITQLALPSLTVTVPVGVPAPGAVTATLAVTAIGAPTSAVEARGMTVCPCAAETARQLVLEHAPGVEKCAADVMLDDWQVAKTHSIERDGKKSSRGWRKVRGKPAGGEP